MLRYFFEQFISSRMCCFKRCKHFLRFHLLTCLLPLFSKERQEVTTGVLPGSLPRLLCDLVVVAAAVLPVCVWCCRCSSVLSRMFWLSLNTNKRDKELTKCTGFEADAGSWGPMLVFKGRRYLRCLDILHGWDGYASIYPYTVSGAFFLNGMKGNWENNLQNKWEMNILYICNMYCFRELLVFVSFLYYHNRLERLLMI